MIREHLVERREILPRDAGKLFLERRHASGVPLIGAGDSPIVSFLKDEESLCHQVLGDACDRCLNTLIRILLRKTHRDRVIAPRFDTEQCLIRLRKGDVRGSPVRYPPVRSHSLLVWYLLALLLHIRDIGPY